MKTLLLMIALYGNSSEKQIPATTTLTGLYYVISVDADALSAHQEILVQINDTLKENNYSIYKTKDYILACRNRNKMEVKGIAAEVKAYFNDEEISMDDAYTFMNNKNSQEAKAYNDENKKRLNEIIGWNGKVKMFYSITVSMQNDSVYLNDVT